MVLVIGLWTFLPHAREAHPEGTIPSLEPWPATASVKDGQLMPQRHVLEGDRHRPAEASSRVWGKSGSTDSRSGASIPWRMATSSSCTPNTHRWPSASRRRRSPQGGSASMSDSRRLIR